MPNEPTQPGEPRAEKAPLMDTTNWIIVGIATVIIVVLIATSLQSYIASKHEMSFRQMLPREASLTEPELRRYLADIDYINKKSFFAEFEYHLRRGTLLLRLNQPEEALKELKITEQLRPNYADCNLQMAKAYLALKDTQQAVVYFQRTLEGAPNNAEANYYLGEHAFREGKLREASNYLVKTANSPEFNAKADPIRRELQLKLIGAVVEPLSTTSLKAELDKLPPRPATQAASATATAETSVTSATSATTSTANR